MVLDSLDKDWHDTRDVFNADAQRYPVFALRRFFTVGDMIDIWEGAGRP